MGIDDVGIIGVGKDTYNSELGGMINGRVLPWVEDPSDPYAGLVIVNRSCDIYITPKCFNYLSSFVG